MSAYILLVKGDIKQEKDFGRVQMVDLLFNLHRNGD